MKLAMAPACAPFALAFALMAFTMPKFAASARRDMAVQNMITLRGLLATGLPDPKCHTGVIAAKVQGVAQVCCAGYCGECSDYPSCGSVRGQNSTHACCKTQVYEMRCGHAPASVCLKKCSE